MPFQSFGFSDARWQDLATLAVEAAHPIFDPSVQCVNHVPSLGELSFHAALLKAHLHFPNKSIIVVRNPHAFVSERFLNAVVALKSRMNSDWSLLSGAGLGVNNERYNAHYSATEPHLCHAPELRSALDSAPDIYVLNAAALNDWFASNIRADAVFEAVFMQHGLLSKRLAFYDPSLGCPINGRYLVRDYAAVMNEISEIAPNSKLAQIVTLGGQFSLAKETAESGQRPGATYLASVPLREVVRDAMQSVQERMTLSIVVRTIFKRHYLLQRLLASIVRALSPAVTVEVLLSSDINPERARADFKMTQQKFPMLNLKLALHNPDESAGTASRVRNLMLGVEKASSEYVWLMDDDDFIDPLAFEHLAAQLYFGVRPLFFVGSSIHREEWEVQDDGRAVLSNSSVIGAWSADAWRQLFEGVNKVPICGVIAPRARLLKALKSIPFRHNLSEDYVMHLALLLDRELPPIVELHQSFSHISMRGAEDSTMESSDRSRWCQDIFGFLHDLQYAGGDLDRSPLFLLLSARRQSETSHPEIEALRASVTHLQTQIASYRRQIAYLLEKIQSPS